MSKDAFNNIGYNRVADFKQDAAPNTFNASEADKGDLSSFFNGIGFGNAEPKQTNVLDAAMGAPPTVMQKLSDTPHMANFQKVNGTAMSVQANATQKADVKGQTQTLLQSRDNAVQSFGKFSADVKTAQNVFLGAMKDACKAENVDFDQAQKSMLPAQNTSDFGRGAQLALDLATPGALALYTMAAQMASEVAQEAKGKLPPKIQSKIMARVEQQLCSAPKNEPGQPAAAPKVKTDFSFENFDFSNDEDMVALFQPPENHPEGKEMLEEILDIDKQLAHLGFVADMDNKADGPIQEMGGADAAMSFSNQTLCSMSGLSVDTSDGCISDLSSDAKDTAVLLNPPKPINLEKGAHTKMRMGAMA